MTPVEMARRFGRDRLCEATRQKLESQPYAPIEVVQVVRKREERDPERGDNRNMPFASFWYEDQGGTELLRESGFRSMPFFFSTWEDARGVYGTGPGDDALADQKGIEAWEKRKAVGIGDDDPAAPAGAGHAQAPCTRHAGQCHLRYGLRPVQCPRPLYEVNFGPCRGGRAAGDRADLHAARRRDEGQYLRQHES